MAPFKKLPTFSISVKFHIQCFLQFIFILLYNLPGHLKAKTQPNACPIPTLCSYAKQETKYLKKNFEKTAHDLLINQMVERGFSVNQTIILNILMGQKVSSNCHYQVKSLLSQYKGVVSVPASPSVSPKKQGRKTWQKGQCLREEQDKTTVMAMQKMIDRVTKIIMCIWETKRTTKFSL